MNSPIDNINHRTMQAAVQHYANQSGVGASEKAALDSIATEFKGKRILDIGVGGGRTVDALHAISVEYVGVDYVQGMVKHCQGCFPQVRFEHADARAMPQFADGAFDLIVFAWAGICMVNHEERLAILREVRRLLTPGVSSFFQRTTVTVANTMRFFGFRTFRLQTTH